MDVEFGDIVTAVFVDGGVLDIGFPGSENRELMEYTFVVFALHPILLLKLILNSIIPICKN